MTSPGEFLATISTTRDWEIYSGELKEWMVRKARFLINSADGWLVIELEVIVNVLLVPHPMDTA